MIRLSLHLNWKFGEDGKLAVDPLLFQLLAGIRDGGSLRSAATAAGVSYRHAWGLLEHWETEFGAPLAQLSRGRGATLTELGEKLLWAESRVQAKLGPELENLASEIQHELLSLLGTGEKAEALKIFASHGLAISVLKQLAADSTELNLDLQFRGSLESLRLLKAGRCDVAGFHIPIRPLGQQLRPRFKPWLRDSQRLIHVVTRTQGLMLARDNPHDIQSLADLTRPGLRFVNRQQGSGTRLLFDQLLENQGILPAKIAGYETEEFTHLAVAAMVASGAADAGFGIEAAAAEMQLSFLPQLQEEYYFCLQQPSLDTPAVKHLLAILRGESFRLQVDRLAGYDPAAAGRIVTVESFLESG